MFFGAFGKPSIFGMVTLVMRCPNYATVKDRCRSGTAALAPLMPALTWVEEEPDKAPSAISREQFETTRISTGGG